MSEEIKGLPKYGDLVQEAVKAKKNEVLNTKIWNMFMRDSLATKLEKKIMLMGSLIGSRFKVTFDVEKLGLTAHEGWDASHFAEFVEGRLKAAGYPIQRVWTTSPHGMVDGARELVIAFDSDNANT